VLRERIEIDGLPLHVLDTAGLRTSGDEIEAEGVRRARAEIERADRVLYIVDAADPEAVRAARVDLESLPKGVPVTVVMNKIDLLGQVPRVEPGPPPRVSTAVKTGAGLRELREHLKECAGYVVDSTGSMSARRRHLDALARARVHVEEAWRQLAERRAGELVAQEFRDAQRALGEITGESDDRRSAGPHLRQFLHWKIATLPRLPATNGFIATLLRRAASQQLA
jgi:tRNA modification GTPase